jgi:uncharacterized protein
MNTNTAAAYEGPVQDQIDLLILQPTPFCNIDCDYCYLPDRTRTKRLTSSVLDLIMDKVVASGLVGDQLSIVWHAGEPLSLPVDYYREAFKLIANKLFGLTEVCHSIQTNGTLINDQWCELFKAHHVNVGISIDGPAFIHDRHRKTRRGGGTHDQVMQGLACLRRHELGFHVIAVVTADSLNNADEIFSFFLDNNVRNVGFNIEELEGVHQISTLAGAATAGGVRHFFGRLYERQKQCKGALRVREFDRAFHAVCSGADQDLDQVVRRNHQMLPFGILSIDCDGNVSTFSPELLGAKSLHYGEFRFGSITRDDELVQILDNPSFIAVANDIAEGVRKCAQECQYFRFCGGGAPSNKCFENGTFASTETMYCRHTIQTPLEIVLADLEAELGLTGASTGTK